MVIDYLSIGNTFRHKLALSLSGFGILAVLISGYTLAVNCLAVSGYGGWVISSQEMVDWLCLLGILVMALALGGMLFHRIRQTALVALLGAGMFVTVTLISMWWSEQLRYQGFVRLTK